MIAVQKNPATTPKGSIEIKKMIAPIHPFNNIAILINPWQTAMKLTAAFVLAAILPTDRTNTSNSRQNDNLISNLFPFL